MVLGYASGMLLTCGYMIRCCNFNQKPSTLLSGTIKNK